MKLSEQLRAARAHIEQPGTWNAGSQDRIIDGVMTHCALGAINASSLNDQDANAVQAALQNVLRRRFMNGTIAEATYGSCMLPPHSWGVLIALEYGAAIAQFNNSTSQADVLALFDEAIADAERDEQPQLPLEIVNLLNTLPVKELADA